MRALLLALAASLTLAACNAGSPAAQLETQWNVCQQSSFATQRVRSCTAVIEAAGVDAQRRAAALVERGSQLAAMGQQTRAIADFGRAMRLDPGSAQPYIERAAVHEQHRAFGAALSDFDAALRIDPDQDAARRGREEVFAQQSAAMREALDRLNEALARDPRDAQSLNNRCWVRALIGEELEAAMSDCNASLRLAPNDPNTLDSRGLVELKAGNYAAAEADYNAAVSFNPDRGHYLYGRGLARLGLGDAAAGDADLAAAVAAQPGVDALYESYGAPLPPPSKS